MATLTETAYYTRRIIVILIASIIGLIVLKISVNLTKNILHSLRPPPPSKPTVDFGKLPKIKFPEEEVKASQPEYRLETIEGVLPTLPGIAKVFFMPRETSGFLSLERAKDRAKKMGFTSSPEKISETVYRWFSPSETKASLEMDIGTGNFQITYDYQEDTSLLNASYLPKSEQATNEAKYFLKQGEYLPDDLKDGLAEYEYFSFAPPVLLPVTSYSEANFVRVYLFRTDIEELKVLPPHPQKPPVNFLFSGARENPKRMVEVHYSYFPVDLENSATYPLKPVNQAWQELQKGEGFVANWKEEGREVVVRNVFLAYFDAEERQDFLQPVYVFEGDFEFAAYVPAIDPQWQE